MRRVAPSSLPICVYEWIFSSAAALMTWTDVRVVLPARPEAKGFRALEETRRERLVEALVDDHAARRGAPLARGAEGRPDDAVARRKVQPLKAPITKPRIAQFPTFWRAYLNTILYSISGAAICVVVTMLTAYPLSIDTFPFRRFFLFLVVFTMLFSGGLIPYYLQIKSLGLVNSPVVMILPGALRV